MAQRFQYSLYGALKATGLLSISVASWSMLKGIDRYAEKWPDVPFVTLVVVLVLTIIATPVLALGSIFERAKTGMLCALVLGAVFIILSVLLTRIFL
jgi:hypothetical protein